MKPTTVCGIIFQQLKRPYQEEHCEQRRKHIIAKSELCKLNNHEYRKKDNGEVGHETEFELIYGHTLFVTAIECSIQLIAEQLQHKCSQQNTEADADIGDKRQSGHHAFQVCAEKHHQSSGNRD